MNLKRYIDAAVRRETRRVFFFRDTMLDTVINNLKKCYSDIFNSSLKQKDKDDTLYGLKSLVSHVIKGKSTNNPNELQVSAMLAQKLNERLKNSSSTTFEDDMLKRKVSAKLVSSVYELKNIATDIYLENLDKG